MSEESSIEWTDSSGPGARPMDASLMKSIHRQYLAQGVPFFFKQWDEVQKKLTGRLLDGRSYDEFPKIESGLIPSLKRRRDLLQQILPT
ncbi:MAG: DUF5131 family protein [Verrucomicrobiaceae bacterium]|nr:MAG: DUF5131 family protein [Verrucomicrobiaceae bacterium]